MSFEFTSPDNRVVLAYDKPALTLLAARENLSGRYLTHEELANLAKRYDVNLVDVLRPVNDMNRFIKDARALEGVEGYVIAFDNGHRIKLKTSFYALRHKALSGLEFEKNVLAWVVDDAVDDIVPLLSPEMANCVRDYQAGIVDGLNRNLAMISEFVADHKDVERRDFAMATQKHIDRRLQGAAFAVRDGQDGFAALKKLLIWAAHSDTRLNTIRDLYKMSWDVDTARIASDDR